MSENKQSNEYSLAMNDYIVQLRALEECEDKILENAGLIFPAVKFIQEAIDEVLEAMKTEALNCIGVDEDVMRIFNNSTTNHNWNWRDDFLQWRKERKGIINNKRNEQNF